MQTKILPVHCLSHACRASLHFLSHAKGSRCCWLPVAGGDSSSTFLSARHGRVVEKFYNNQAEALHEWRMVQCVMALAPQYTASPASLSMGSGQQAHNSGLYYILTTQYAGDMLVTRLDERRLDADEFRLCLLQAIHFALLLGNTSVLVHDIHPINICVRNAGSQIEVRWIDFVIWRKKDPRKEPERTAACFVGSNERETAFHGWYRRSSECSISRF